MRVLCTQNTQLVIQILGGNVSNDQVVIARGSIMTNLQRENTQNQANPITICRAKVRNQMKDQTARTRDKPESDDDIRALLPSTNSSKRSTPAIPSLLQDLGDLPVTFTQTVVSNPEQFLIYDNGPNINERLLVFANKEGLRRLASVDTIYMDGNFYMVPNVFRQLDAIRVPFGVTAVYALLPNKTRATYEELFQDVVVKCAELDYEVNLQIIVTDFEDAVLRLIFTVFGRDVNTKGCFYHLGVRFRIWA